MTELSRRRFLQGLLSLGLAPLVGCGAGDRSPVFSLLDGLLQEIALPDPLRVGQAHLRDQPADRDPSQLLQAVFADLPLHRDLPHLCRAFAQRLRSEFTAQQTVQVDGWLLARSEAQFCALLTICHALAQVDPGGPR
jgi:hypothetical protein